MMFLLGLLTGCATGAGIVGFSVFLGYRLAQLHAEDQS